MDTFDDKIKFLKRIFPILGGLLVLVLYVFKYSILHDDNSVTMSLIKSASMWVGSLLAIGVVLSFLYLGYIFFKESLNKPVAQNNPVVQHKPIMRKPFAVAFLLIVVLPISLGISVMIFYLLKDLI